MSPSQSVAVIFFSNPPDSGRLRLDLEHRSIDELLDKLNLDPGTIKKVLATSVEDMVDSLRDSNCKIVQFSGHGTHDGFLLEDRLRGRSQWISASRVAAILTQTIPRVTAAIFMSCFSAQSIAELIHIAPYLVTVTGPADDEAAIAFIAEFYTTFFESNSVEKAFSMAQLRANINSDTSQISAVLSRRAVERLPGHVLFQVFPGNGLDSILIDLSEVEHEIEALDIGKDRFLTLLSRKIRIHRWVFSTPRERTLLSIGPYFGIFSWKDANDVVACDRLLRLKPDTEEEVCEAWASLIVTYNDHYMDRYRLLPSGRDNPALPRLLKKAANEHHTTFQAFFEGKYADALQSAVPEQYKTTRALASANLRMCDVKLHEEDYASAVVYLESTLSAIHDLVDALTEALTS